jgi:hypothetical protein
MEPTGGADRRDLLDRVLPDNLLVHARPEVHSGPARACGLQPTHSPASSAWLRRCCHACCHRWPAPLWQLSRPQRAGHRGRRHVTLRLLPPHSRGPREAMVPHCGQVVAASAPMRAAGCVAGQAPPAHLDRLAMPERAVSGALPSSSHVFAATRTARGVQRALARAVLGATALAPWCGKPCVELSHAKKVVRQRALNGPRQHSSAAARPEQQVRRAS